MSKFVHGFGRLAGIACLVAATSANAFTMVPVNGSAGTKLRMVDARVNLPDSYQRSLAARPGSAERGLQVTRTQLNAVAQAAQALLRVMPGIELKFSNLTGSATSVVNHQGFLTDAAPGERSEDIVRGFLGQFGALYGLSNADLKDLVALGDSAGGTSGMRMLRLEQRIDSVPVFQSESRFTLDRDGRMIKSVGVFVPHARDVAPNVNWSVLLTPESAVSHLLAAEGKAIGADAFGQVGESQGWLRLERGDDYVTDTISARKVLFPLAPGVLVPAWSLVVFTAGDADWYAVVDAQTGDLLWRKNIRASASTQDARFRVYVQADGTTPADSPAPQSPDSVAPGSGTQFPAIAPTIVSMQAAYDPVASPNGWIDDCPGGVCTANQTQTLGNNTLVCMDRTGTANVCDTTAATVIDGNGRATGNPDANSRNRDFLGTTPRDFQTGYLPPPQGGNPASGQTASGNGTSGTAAVDQFRRGMMTHLFYVTNWYHDKLYKLGFDEASANFQVTNFSGQGLGNDRVLGDADDGSGTNNANFSTPPDGTSGRMQMYYFGNPAAGSLNRDGALDAEISMHEMTHGTSNRLVGNGAGLNWDPAGGMGEGWSDFYALSLLNNTNADDPNGRYASGAYATYKLSTSTYVDNYVYGIRRFPYSTDNTVNPLTWADVDQVTNSTAGGIAADPLGFNLNGAMEVHNIGEIWANTLWEVRSRVIADPAGANGDVPTGNHTMLQLATDGLKLTPINPSFTDARDAILDADCGTNACANEASIWGGFADRGLGYGASTPFNTTFGWFASHMAVRESFKVPYLAVVNTATDVVINDTAGNNTGAADPGEQLNLTVKLTNPWRATSKAITGATATLTTSTAGVTIPVNTSTYGAIAAAGSASGTPFTIKLDGSVLCGSSLDFTLTTVSSLGTTSTTFTLRAGAESGTDAAVTYTDDPNPNVSIPDQGPTGIKRTIAITDDFKIADLNFTIIGITHPGVDDITAMLRSPDGVGTDLVALIGATNGTGLGGANLTNMVIDDDVANTVANDMVQAASSAAPYTKSWQPVFNSPWAPANIGAADPVGNLTRYNGLSTKGTWTAVFSDQLNAANGGSGAGTLNAWSMTVTPVHFACTAVTSTVVLSAKKTVSGTFTVGSTVIYSVVLTNTGSGAQADNAGNEFTDVLPAGLTLVNATATSGTATTAGNTVNWNGALAASGGTTTITITATINAGTQGTTISNQGTASYDADVNGSNEATLLTDDPGVAGATNPTVFTVLKTIIGATKSVSGTFKVGNTVTYSVVLSNTGTGAQADNAGNEFTDVLPAGLALVSATATSGTASTAGNTANWNGAIPAAGSVTITITATINAGTQGTTISNQGSVSYDGDVNGSNETTLLTDDPGVAGATDPTVFTVLKTVIGATKAVSGTFKVGNTVTYSVVLSNTGTAAQADNAGNEFTDVLPAGLTLVNATATSGTASTAGNTANWNGSIPAAGSVTITITATINAGAQGTTISNQGSVSYDGDVNGSNETTLLTDDPGVAGATDPTVFTVLKSAVTATKTVTGNRNVGDTMTYTIVLSNSGTAAAADNAGNELSDVLPANLTLVDASATSGTAVATVGTNTVTWNGAVAAAGSVTITIHATIKADQQELPVSNQATVNFDADLNGSNETTILSDDPSVGGASDPTVFTVTDRIFYNGFD